MHQFNNKITIVGAGLSGLATAVQLEKYGYTNITIIDKDNAIGGRMQTDYINGFQLDRGFHTVFTAYQYLNLMLDVSKLELQHFNKAIKIVSYQNNKLISKTYNTIQVFKNILSFKLYIKDAISILKLRRGLKKSSFNEIFEKFEVKTSTILKKKKFSTQIINEIIKPIFSGIFLENELKTSRRLFDYYTKMIIEGQISIPKKGIAQIPNLLLSKLKHTKIILNREAIKFENNELTLDNQESIQTEILVIATTKNTFYSKYVKNDNLNTYLSTTCLYYTCDYPPHNDKILVVNANSEKLVTNYCVISNINPNVAPANKHLICVNINGIPKVSDQELDKMVKLELLELGTNCNDWSLLKSYHIPNALPEQEYVLGKRTKDDLKVSNQIFISGDHLYFGSIEACLVSGVSTGKRIHHEINPNYISKKESKYKDIIE